MPDFSNKAVELPLDQVLNYGCCNNELFCAVSLTGVTILKEGRYRSRHNKIDEACQYYNRPYITQAEYKEKFPNEFIKKTKRKKRKTDEEIVVKKRVKKSEFKVDKKQVSHRIRQFVNQMGGEKKLFFWSITFEIGTSDDCAHLLWNKWLTRLRKEKMIKEYLWVTERQKNKTIHFHMCINHYMDAKWANKYMRAAIMTSIDKKEIDWTREAAKNYNGVHISKNKKTGRAINFAKKKNEKSLTNYLTKYVTKNDEGFPHLAWHSSRGYSNLIITFRLTLEEFKQSNIEYLLDYAKKLDGQYFTFIRWKSNAPPEIIKYFSQLNNYIQTIIAN